MEKHCRGPHVSVRRDAATPTGRKHWTPAGPHRKENQDDEREERRHGGTVKQPAPVGGVSRPSAG